MEGEDTRLLGGGEGGTNEEGSAKRGHVGRKLEGRVVVRQDNRGSAEPGFFPPCRMPATGMRDHGIQHHVTHLC